ncbi:dnaJ homolog subfamily C member 2 [Lingula anatina]|uniref:DnaJ homolog subfamily C member 2 n=1 Tax=Lingula anatina TaxID=7574 RepID=A0A1S3K2U8_LINAN|nr:dnaJ homolog subfamily C member 2 [Lingula anatina]|eukprot:XP_013416847.1 dnaJ homolog subfamily C member 2 [Lingula anatina]
MDSPPAEEDRSMVVAKISPLQMVSIEPVGRWFEAYCLRRRNKQSLSHTTMTSSSSEENISDASTDEEDELMLKGLDPKEWKQQDHYAVLGLKNERYKATEEQIKRAYKKKVLKHHPDKRKARGENVKEGDDDYFTCITRAYEILGNRVKRRSYDSVDPQFDDDVPEVSSDNKDKEEFFEVFRPVFEANARWSNKKKPVPQLGDIDSSFDEVNDFYAFWYDFDSWREYSYLDEEEKEKGQDREERKWIERQNKAARAKRKKEEVTRIRLLVDNAYACDPRIQRFKDEEKEKKLAQKRAKQEAARQKAEEEKRKKEEELEAERKQKEKEEEEAKAQAAAAKKEKEAMKKILKKERKTLRTIIKEFDYFAADEAERVKNMADVEKLADMLSLTSLQSLNEALTSGDKERASQAFTAEVKELDDKREAEKQKLLEATKKQNSGGGSAGARAKQWSDEETQILIKAVNLFPAGTKQRWEVIANYINQHVEGSNRTPKEVLGQAKALQKNVMDESQKQLVNEKAFEILQKEKEQKKNAKVGDKPSERVESVGEQQVAQTGSNPAPWTTEEQKLLEQALKTFPASVKDRWDRIAETIATRSKKDCMKRYKELAEMVKAKKAAQAAADAKAAKKT